MKERAYAKINLCLDVVGEREDGYHELKMIMAPVDFYDVLDMTPAEETTFEVNRSFLPVDDRNTVVKAIRVMREKYGFTEEFACRLQKHIPTQAGLAGGSADAAAAIRLMCRMLGITMSREELIEVGKKVGADVPFCIFNQCAYVGGIGDQLEPFACNTDFEILLVKPRRGVSTKTAFAEMNRYEPVHPDCDAMRTALINDDYAGVVSSLGNSLEAVSLNLVKEIREIREDLLELGFDGALMSGSGSTVFGITRSPRLLKKTADLMKYKGYFVRITKILK